MILSPKIFIQSTFELRIQCNLSQTCIFEHLSVTIYCTIGNSSVKYLISWFASCCTYIGGKIADSRNTGRCLFYFSIFLILVKNILLCIIHIGSKSIISSNNFIKKFRYRQFDMFKLSKKRIYIITWLIVLRSGIFRRYHSQILKIVKNKT